MLTGIDIGEVYGFSSSYDKGEPKTIFLICNLPNNKKLQFFQNPNEKELMAQLSLRSFEILKAGLKGIENFVNPKTKQAVNISEITDDILNQLPLTILIEVFNEIIKYNFIGDTELKN